MATVTHIPSDSGWESRAGCPSSTGSSSWASLTGHQRRSRLLRIFLRCPTPPERESVANGNLAPVLISDQRRPLVFMLLRAGRLGTPRLRRPPPFGPTEEPVEPFFTTFRHSTSPRWPVPRGGGAICEARRRTSGERRYRRGGRSDQVSAFGVFPQTEEPEVGTHVLRSLARANAVVGSAMGGGTWPSLAIRERTKDQQSGTKSSKPPSASMQTTSRE
jgi:hypothetical protein